jgi:protein tyrosine phosphatase (PTP) superfamily phosphohydrolase (DUF442 family)
MKKVSILFLFIVTLIIDTNAQDMSKDSCGVEKIEGFENLYQYQNYYISGQPNLQMLQWLKDQDVNAIINLRSEDENIDYSDYAFDEESNAIILGIEYFSVPIDGMGDYTPENLDDLAYILKKKDKVLIHCNSAGRATNFFMAYLIKHKGYTVDDAVEVGKGLKFTMPLEKLLDAEITMEIKE